MDLSTPNDALPKAASLSCQQRLSNIANFYDKPEITAFVGRAVAQGSESDQQHDVTVYSRDQLINDLLNAYACFRHVRRLS